MGQGFQRLEFNRSHGFTVRPTMAARSYMQENTFNMGDGRVKSRGTTGPATATGEWTTGHLGPWISGLETRPLERAGS